jgi:hypothetical protein
MNETEWEQMLQYAFLNVWSEASSLLPNIIGAIIVLIVGVLIANAVKAAIVALSSKMGFDNALQATGAPAVVAKTGYTLNTGKLLGTVAKWFILIVFFIFALDILNLTQATAFLTEAVLTYLPRVFVATIILFGALILSQFVERIVVAGATAANVQPAALLGKFSKFAVMAFAILAALNELQIANELVQMLFAGFVFALSLAFGLSFGLGGREAASRYIEKLEVSARNKVQTRL